MNTTVAKIRRELDRLNRVFAPKEKVRMSIDMDRLTPLQKKTVMDASRLICERRRKEPFDFNKFSPKEQKLLLDAEAILQEYSEPERDIRARQPPIH